MHTPLNPKFIALCGAPETGKTTVADYMAARYGGRVIDDGKVLREACRALYGLSHEDVYTQAGKARIKSVGGREFSHRQLLGDLGNLLEGFYGQQFMPERAIESIAPSDTARFFLFPSCRKTQGITYRAQGGVVIELIRPDHFPINDFDQYDRSLVSHVLSNDRDLPALFYQVDFLMERVLGFSAVLPGFVK